MRNLKPNEIFKLAKAFVKGNKTLKQSPFWSRDKMISWQFERVKALVRHAYYNVEFYRRLYDNVSFNPSDLKTWEDFNKLPIVKKEDVINNYPDKILQKGIDIENLIVSRSSGSSGKVLDIAYDSAAFTTYILAAMRLYRMGFKYKPWHKQVYIYTSPYPMRSLLGMYPLIFVSTLTAIDEVIKILRKHNPELIVCYPSHLKQIAFEMKSEDRDKIRPKAISVNSEMSTQKERNELADFFECPVLDEYSSEELTRIAAQCYNKTYHIFEDINYMETLDDNGKPTAATGILTGTNLHNLAMPMIRYQQNDLGQIVDENCSCGWKFRKLKKLQGRKNDSFILPSGKILTSGFLLDLTYDFLLEDRTAVLDFCLIQQEKNKIVLEIVKGKGWGNFVAEKIKNKFNDFLEEDVNFCVKVVNECTKTKTGKRNPIINLSNRQK